MGNSSPGHCGGGGVDEEINHNAKCVFAISSRYSADDSVKGWKETSDAVERIAIEPVPPWLAGNQCSGLRNSFTLAAASGPSTFGISFTCQRREVRFVFVKKELGRCWEITPNWEICGSAQ